MITTTIVYLEVILLVIWLIYKIACVIRRNKFISTIVIIGILYILISWHSSNILNKHSQKNNNLTNNGHESGGIADNSAYFNSSLKSQSFLYPGDNSHETGADGHRITLHNNGNAIDPTYKQMISFIKSDKTDEIPYNYSSFACTDFAERLHNNAEAAGYKCAWVDINFINGGAAYACNAFNTVDCGLVFVDCFNCGNSNNDKSVDLKVGKGYIPEDIGDLHYTYYSMGIVKSYQVYW